MILADLLFGLMLFSAGALSGYYVGLCREHRIHMTALDKLKSDLTAIDAAKRKLRETNTWESQSRN